MKQPKENTLGMERLRLVQRLRYLYFDLVDVLLNEFCEHFKVLVQSWWGTHLQRHLKKSCTLGWFKVLHHNLKRLRRLYFDSHLKCFSLLFFIVILKMVYFNTLVISNIILSRHFFPTTWKVLKYYKKFQVVEHSK